MSEVTTPLKQIVDIETDTLLSQVLVDLVNEFPSPMVVTFNNLNDREGIAIFPQGSTFLLNEVISITDYVRQECFYSFNIIYRISPRKDGQKMRVKEYLDMLGSYLEKQAVTIDDTVYKIDEYPELSAGKKILSITRSSQAYLASQYEDGVEDWLVGFNLVYKNEFQR